MKKVKEMMVTQVLTLKPSDRLDLADDMVKWQRIRHIPVIDSKKQVVGILSQRDLLKAAVSTLRHISEKEQKELFGFVQVKDVMTSEVFTIGPNDEISDAADTMLSRKIGCLPVVEKGKLVGIITESDFVALACSDKSKRRATGS